MNFFYCAYKQKVSCQFFLKTWLVNTTIEKITLPWRVAHAAAVPGAALGRAVPGPVPGSAATE